MKERQKINTLRAVKKLKLAKNRKGSDIFSCLNNKPESEFKAAAPHASKELLILQTPAVPKPLLHTKGKKRDERQHILERIKSEWPIEKASALSKKIRKTYKLGMSSVEYEVFCWYVKSCRRGRKRFSQKPKKNAKQSLRVTYENFINSVEWRDIKNRFYQKHGRFCAACGSVEKVRLHHMVYGHFGHEKDEHLIPLCETHHNQYHAENGTQRNMITKTLAFIERIKGEKLVLAA